jgi:cytochrome d ubiquinol oxidase subunit I
MGIYLYGWDRVSARVHFLSGVVVSVSGAASAVFVTFANAWMNTPTGFRLDGQRFVDIHPFAAMMNPAALPEAIHMILAAYCASGFATAGIHAYLLLGTGRNRFHESAIKIAFGVGAIACLLQCISGDALARMVAVRQPVKLASMESLFQTQKGAPLLVGGLPDVTTGTNRFGIDLPNGLSLLAFHDPHATVRGLNDFPREDWPAVPLVHISFQIMVGCASLLALVSVVAVWGAWRKKHWITDRRALGLLVFISPLGFVALESGWMVTELGRQPWIIHGVLRTRDSVTATTHLFPVFVWMTLLYCCLGITVLWLMQGHVVRTPTEAEVLAATTEVPHAA